MSDASSPADRPDNFKAAVIVMLTLISLFAALVTVLQNHASVRSSDLAQRSSLAGVNSTGLYLRSGLDVVEGVEVLQRYETYVQRSVRADTKAKALRMGGRAEQAAEYTLDADRWRRAAEEVRDSNPLLSGFGQDQVLYRETLAEEAYLEEEREHTLFEQSRAYSTKANSYVAVLSTLSVALFLGGLSLTLSSRLRYALALAAVVLTVVCAAWTLLIAITPVPVISEEAIRQFVDGRIKYTLANERGEDATGSIAEFTRAISLAPDYGRAYFYRSLANTDSSLINKHLDTQDAIDDALRAIELGNEGAPVYGNLGWLYYLNGQYRSALENTEIALSKSPDDCYLPFNRGLILMAQQRQAEADAAYDVAIDCARRQSSDFYFNYYIDVGVTDLMELAEARPDLANSLEPAIRRLRETHATLAMYGDMREHAVEAQFGEVAFGTWVDDDGIVQDTGVEFPQSTTIIYAQLPFEGMRANQRWMTRWLLDGREYLSTVYETWDYGESGQMWVNLYNQAGLNSGEYELDVFVEGRLVARGHFVILPGNLPPMYYYESTGVGVTISYPLDWNITDLADNEVSVVAARDPDSQTFFGVTAWVAGTGTDEDVFQLFDLYLDALAESANDFTSEDREAFTVAGLDGWLNYYTYIDAAGNPIQGALAGVLDENGAFTYIVVIEAHADEWDPQIEVFNAMLERMTIDRE